MDGRVEPGKQGQQGTQMFLRGPKSGADFSLLMFSDAADPPAKTTADLWPSLSHSHTNTQQNAAHCTRRQSCLPHLSGGKGATAAAMSGSWQQGRCRVHRRCYSRTSSHSQSVRAATPALCRSHFYTCMRGTHTHSFNVTLWCP